MPFRIPTPGGVIATGDPPKPLELNGIRMTWTGWDGSTWVLGGDSSAPVRLLSGSRLFGMPDTEHYEDEFAGQPGSQWLASRDRKRTWSWVLGVFDRRGEQDWADLDAAFWRTMDPQRPGTLTATQPSGESRSVRMRFVSDNDHLTLTDPLLVGFETYQIELQSEWPYPQGPTIERTFAAADPHDLYPDDDSDPYVFWFTAGDSVDSATITNAGDVDGYLAYAIVGPTTSVTVRGNTFPVAIASGKAILFDTDPRSQVALEANAITNSDGSLSFALTGVDRSGEMTAVNFAPIAPGESVPVAMTMTGSGTVSVKLTPSYRRFR